MKTGSRILLVLALIALVAGAGRTFAANPRTLAIRDRVYDKLSQAQQAVEAEDWDEAFAKLRDVEKIKDLDAHEKAQLYTAYGYAHFARGRYVESTEAYERVLEQADLPEAMLASTRYTLAQLWFQREDYTRAAEHLEWWLEAAENPGPEPYVLLGQAYYQLGRPADAVAPVSRAVAIAEARDQPPRENWYALLRVFHYELEDYPRLLEVLEILVTRFPNKEYWLHLASAYGELGDAGRRLAAYEAAFAQGFLTTGPERMLLAQLRLQADLPYRAGVVLDEGLGSGIIEGSADNWRLLSQAWTLAHEHDRAIAALRRAATLSDDGELDARIAQSHAALDDWESTVAAARVALDKGVADPHELRILIGMALFELGRLDEARAAFVEARRSPEGRRTASQWLAYMENEEARLSELERSLR